MLLSIIMIGKEENNIPLPSNVELLFTRGFDIPRVVKKAKGDFIVFIKEDDEITVKYLEYVLKVCESNLCDLCFINYSINYEGVDIKINTSSNDLQYGLLPGDYIWSFIYRRECFIKAINLKIKNESTISKIFKKRTNIAEVIYIHNPHKPKLVNDFFLTDIKPEYRYTNLIYIGEYINGLFNGYVSWLMNIGRCFKDKDITLVFTKIHPDIYNKLIKYFRCVKYDNSCNYLCDRFITTYSTYYYPKNFIPLESASVFIHGVLSYYFKKGETAYKHDLYDHYICVSKTAAKGAKGYLPTDNIEYILNPISIPKELVKPHLYLVSTLRGSSKLKGLDYIKTLASIFDEEDIPYTWDVFTDVETNTNKGGLIFRNSVVNPLPYVKDADYFVHLSETEACSYSMMEALMLNVKIVALHIELYDELGFTGSKNTTYIPLNYFKNNDREKLKKIALKLYKNKDYEGKYNPKIEFRKGYNQVFKKEEKLSTDKKISIIIPCYNSEKTIDRCLNSLLNQTYKNLEIVCIDDESSDNTLDKLKEYASKDSRIKYIQGKHRGASGARNIGLDNSTGDYIMFCDSDDYYNEDTCEVMLRDMLKYNVDVVRGRHRYENASVDCNYKYYGLYDFYKIREEVIPGLLDGGILGFVVLLMIKREVLKKVRFNEELMMMEDKAFSLNLYLNINSFYQSDKVIYNYVVNPNSVSSLDDKKIKRIEDNINVYLIIKKLLSQNGLFSRENESKLISAHYYIFSREIDAFKNPKSRELLLKLLNKLSKNEEFNHFINNVPVGYFKDRELIIYNFLVERDYEGLLDYLLMKDKISIIIPVHNDRKTLKRCLDSVVNQTYKNLEIIIVDGSKDSSLKIVKKYQENDKRIKIITGEDKGLGRAKSVGFKKATGKYIGVVDADDYIDLSMYDKMHDMAILNEVDLVRCQYYIHERNNEVRKSCNSMYGIVEKDDALDLFLKRVELSSNWSFLYTKELVEGLDFGGFAFAEDFYFNFMTVLRCKRLYISEEAYYNYDTVSKEDSSRKYEYDKALKEVDAHLGVDNAIYNALGDRIKKYRITCLDNTFNGFTPSIKNVIYKEDYDKYKEFVKKIMKLDSFKIFNEHREKYKQELIDKIFVNYDYYYEVKKINK